MSGISVSKSSVFSGHRDCVYVLAEGSTPNIVFSGAGDGMVVKWDLTQPDQGELIAKLDNSIYAIHYHSLTNILIVGHNYDGIHYLDWENKKEIKSLHIGKSTIFDIKSIGNLLLVGLDSGEIVIVDSETNTIINRLSFSDKSARSITIHPNENQFAVGYSDHCIRIYNSIDFSLKNTLTGHSNSVFTVKYSPDGKRLLSAGRDAHLKIWDVVSFELTNDIVAHTYAINDIYYNPKGTHFATCSMDKSIKLWDAKSEKLLKVIDKSRHAGHGTSVNKLLWSDFNDQLISASDDRQISVWDIILP